MLPVLAGNVDMANKNTNENKIQHKLTTKNSEISIPIISSILKYINKHSSFTGVAGGTSNASIKIFNYNIKKYSTFDKDNNQRIILGENKYCINSYLAGLFEGDGHIQFIHIKNKKPWPYFCITFNIKDLPLANKLISLIGFGRIRYKIENNACVLIISNTEGIIKIANLINGELKTPKINQFHNLIDWINQYNYSSIKNYH